MNDVLKRVAATFAVGVLGTVGAGAFLDVEVWKSSLMAGIGAVAMVVEALGRAFLNDGKLTEDEINAVFAKYGNGEDENGGDE
jgi:hypothetical protein